MNTSTLLSRHRNQSGSTGKRISQLVRPLKGGQMLLPLAMAMCAALGASHMQAFVAKHRMLVAGVAPSGIAISDGEHSYLVSEAELDVLLGEVERLS